MNGIIAWFARNHVAANLVMVTIIIGGTINLFSIKKEVFPSIDIDMIEISVPYPGAAPVDVEKAIVVRVEEAIYDLPGVKKITSKAFQNSARILVEVETGHDTRELLSDIKSRIDAISTFPTEVERPRVKELIFRDRVITAVLFGEVGEMSLKQHAEQIRDELSALPGVSLITIYGTRPYEMAIEISEYDLQKFDLAFSDVVNAVRSHSIDLSAGSVKTRQGKILIQTEGQKEVGKEFSNIPLITTADGARVRLGDVAKVLDGFEDIDVRSTYNGLPAATLSVIMTGSKDVLEMTAAVEDYVETKRKELPNTLQLETWRNKSVSLKDRMNLMMKNAIGGLMLVFLVLFLFLRGRLAFWVCLGIPISFLGAIWTMTALGVSINMISLFAFILVLGVVVDDAIIVGESIHSHQEGGQSGVTGSIIGAQFVAKPIIFAVFTTMAAFVPMLLLPGPESKIWSVIPSVVISTLFFSLVESLIILPAHLSTIPKRKEPSDKPKSGIIHGFNRVGDWAEAALSKFANEKYQPFLMRCLSQRYLTLAVFFGGLIIVLAIAKSGWLKTAFFPEIPSDYVEVEAELISSVAYSKTLEVQDMIESAAQELKKELLIDEDPEKPLIKSIRSRSNENGISVMIQLTRGEERTLSNKDVAQLWESKIGPIPNLADINFSYTFNDIEKPIDLRISSSDLDQLAEAVELTKKRLEEYPGVMNIVDSNEEGIKQINIRIKPQAEHLGLSQIDLARQVRQGFYGEEAQRIPRGRDDIRVMVRYPLEDRQSLSFLESMRIRTQAGDLVPFSEVAEVEFTRSPAVIQREDRMRSVRVKAGVDDKINDAGKILGELKQEYFAELEAQLPGVNIDTGGQQKRRSEISAKLGSNFMMALLVIYALMAIPFASYIQPMIVMLAIPFGFMGAIVGHLLLGIDLSMLSFTGMIAVAGVVVNDSLVLMDYINHRIRAGVDLIEAVQEAGVARFRPILLTSLTTFAGLTPMLFETSIQAQFLIPMVVSLAFGVLFATVITLVLVPACYLALYDLKRLIRGADAPVFSEFT